MDARDLSNLYFKKTISKDQDKLTMDADMIRLLLVIDENKNVSQLAKSTGMALPTVKQILAKLLKLKLIVPVQKEIAFLNQSFFDALRQRLTQAVGPMGEILIEDTIDDMGLEKNRVPIHAAPELIKQLASEIPQGGGRQEFENAIMAMIPKG